MAVVGFAQRYREIETRMSNIEIAGRKSRTVESLG